MTAGDDAREIVHCVGGIVTRTAPGASAGEQLLLVRRRHPPGAGRWSLPGGRVEPGEDDPTAVAREVAEETGLRVEVGPWVGTVRRPAPDGRIFDIRDHRAVPADPGSEPVAGDDASDVRWVDAATYAAMDAAGELVAGLTDALAGWGALPRA